MKRFHRELIIVLAVFFLSGFAASSSENCPSGKEESDRPALASIRKLVGLWARADLDGNPVGHPVSSYRLTAGGTAVVEVTYPGAPLEMVTVYHEDRGDLVLAHYCMLGNQPRLRAVPGKPGELLFKCIGGGNMNSEDDRHMHELRYEFVNENRIRTEWLMHENGKPVQKIFHDLVRVGSPEPEPLDLLPRPRPPVDDLGRPAPPPAKAEGCCGSADGCAKASSRAPEGSRGNGR